MARLMVVFLIFREFITPTLLKIWILGGSADALFDFGFVMKLTVKSNSQIEDTDPKVLAVQVSQYSMQSKSPDLCCMKLSRQDIKAQLV